MAKMNWTHRNPLGYEQASPRGEVTEPVTPRRPWLGLNDPRVEEITVLEYGRVVSYWRKGQRGAKGR